MNQPLLIITEPLQIEKQYAMQAAKEADFGETWSTTANRALALQNITYQTNPPQCPPQETYITAAQARELGAGNAEYQYSKDNAPWSNWITCVDYCQYEKSNDSWMVKYRAIKQSHPDNSKIRVGDKVRIGVYVCGEFKPMGLAIVVEDVDAQLCKVDKMSLHGGAPWITLEQKSHLRKEPKAQPEPVGIHLSTNPENAKFVYAETVDKHATLRAEYAKQVAEGTTGFYLWELMTPANPDVWQQKLTDDEPHWTATTQYRCTDISCYVSKDGEPAIRMLRTEAQVLQRKTKNTHDWFTTGGALAVIDFLFADKGLYTYRTKALKQPTWTGSREDVIALLKEKELLK
jgi:hypothetical protein